MTQAYTHSEAVSVEAMKWINQSVKTKLEVNILNTIKNTSKSLTFFESIRIIMIIPKKTKEQTILLFFNHFKVSLPHFRNEYEIGDFLLKTTNQFKFKINTKIWLIYRLIHCQAHSIWNCYADYRQITCFVCSFFV